jgi:acetyl esterase/lipase
MTVSPKLSAFLKQSNTYIKRMKTRGVLPTPETARAGMAQLAGFISDIPEIAHIEDRVIVTDDLKIPVKIYSPSPDVPLPVLMYYHGGGHLCGNTDQYDPITRKLALSANVIVVSVDYRLAPENPYPAGIDDCFHATLNVWDVLNNVKHQRCQFIAGDSAGGAIAASIIMRNQDRPDLAIEKQVLIYPGLDYTLSSVSYQRYGSGYLLETDKIRFYFDNYFQQNENRLKASPLFGRFSPDMPQTLVITAGFDPLKEEGRAYYTKVKEQGVYALHYEFPEMIHAFMNLEDLVKKEVEELYQRIADFLKISSSRNLA